MAGFSRLYVMGGEGGFMGADGANPIGLFILVGDADRQWLQPHYVDASLGPLGHVARMVPAGPDHPDMLLDACIAFAPRLFASCPTLKLVSSELGDTTFLDFHLRQADIPAHWATLREEARPVFASLSLWRADFVRVQGSL